MNKLIEFLCIFVCLSLSADLLATASKSAKTIIVSGLPDYFPFSFEENGELKGVFIDLSKDIFAKLKIPVGYRIFPWKRVLNNAKHGRIDMIAGLYKSQVRETYIDYSVAIIPDPTAVFMRKGNEFEYGGWDDLKGKSGVTGLGYVLGDKFSRYEKQYLNLYRVEGSKRAFTLLADNKRQFDYTVNGFYHSLQLLTQLGLSDKITYSTNYVTEPLFYFGYSKKKLLGDLSKKVNKLLIQYKRNKLIKQYINKYVESLQIQKVDMMPDSEQ
ncbi:substrate-binding periplasmic protein [Spartinivicinus poritis]|uniref:Transporter substrate-binding domain-containing protein n=1 Tax=Spartinivicinus poritis TaxID=2994640 RepID=A0ABT5UBC6_9GAMM|nr:transporter substrate-binding domain-containing protein [Spartinivicinus sp. A2-2]MDE1463672.1 transporter substrate-binding domain-containing protein [Spartinivicinus sp. A2-2]